MKTLAKAIGGSQPPDDGLRFGEIVTTNPLIVSVTGGLIPAGIQGSYLPAVGDSVSLIRQDGTWLVTGRVGGSEMAYPTAVWVIDDASAQAGVTALSSAPANITGAAGQISKASASSIVKLDFAMTHFVSTAGTNVEYSVAFTSGGGSPLVIAFHNRFWNTITSHLQVSCHRPLTGIPAGDWDVQFRWGAVTLPGGGSFSRDAGDTFTAFLEER